MTSYASNPRKRHQSRSPSPTDDDNDTDNSDRQPTPPPFVYSSKPLPPPIPAQVVHRHTRNTTAASNPSVSPPAHRSTPSSSSSSPPPAARGPAFTLAPGDRFVAITGSDSACRMIVAESRAHLRATSFSVLLNRTHRIPYIRAPGDNWYAVLTPSLVFPDSVGRRWAVPARDWIFVDCRKNDVEEDAWGERDGKLVGPGSDVGTLLVKFLQDDRTVPWDIRWEMPF